MSSHLPEEVWPSPSFLYTSKRTYETYLSLSTERPAPLNVFSAWSKLVLPYMSDESDAHLKPIIKLFTLT
jgi:hypothetical protein